MATILKQLVKKPKVKKTINLKVTPEEAMIMKSIAKKYAKGNLTALIRIAVSRFKPRKEELTRVRN